MGRKGQSILEYVLVLTAIIAAVVIGARTFIGPAVGRSFSNNSDTIDDAIDRMPGI